MVSSAIDNNEDTKSTSSTLVNGEETARNNDDIQTRHGFDQELYEEDIIRFLYYSEKRHETNGKLDSQVKNSLKDWVNLEKCVLCIVLMLINIASTREDKDCFR